MESIKNLSQSTIDDLQDLIEVNIDSAKGYETAAATIENPQIAMLFRTCAAERSAHVRELRDFVPDYEPSGSIKGKVHRWWLDLRGTLNGGDEYPVLAEVERGEDAIKERYEKILTDNPGTALNDRLQRQYAEVKARHDQMRELRDSEA